MARESVAPTVKARRLDTAGLRAWGAGLDDAQFTRALSALGTLLAASKARDAAAFRRWVKAADIAVELASAVAPRPDERRRIAWTISPVVDGSGKVDDLRKLDLDPLALSGAWAAAIASIPNWDPRGAPSFEVRASTIGVQSHARISAWLGPPDALTASFVADPELGDGGDFEWPVRVAAVPGPGAEAFLDRLRTFAQSQHPWVLNLVEFIAPGGPEEPCDILLAPWSLGQAVAQLSYLPHGIDAACLIALDGIGFAGEVTVGEVRDGLVESVDAWAVGVLEVPDIDRDRWFVDLIRELSHDSTIDRALRYSTMGGPVPLVIADPSALNRMGVREAAARAVRALEGHTGDTVEIPVLPPGSFPLGPGRYKRSEILRLFRDPQAFGQESSGATAVSILSRIPETYEAGGPGYGAAEEANGGGMRNGGGHAANGGGHAANGGGHAANGGGTPRNGGGAAQDHGTRAKPPTAAAKPPGRGRPTPTPARYLQAQIRKQRGEAPKLVRGALDPRTDYLLDVHVGPPRRNWARGDVALPPDAVPQDGKRHRLRVVFDPGGRSKPQVSSIVLPAAGASTTCRFEFKTPGRGRFRGRVIVQFRNRVLQTALITSDLAGGAPRAGAGTGTQTGLRVRIEATLRPGMVALDKRRPYDLAIVHNDDDEGKPRATASAGTWAATLRTVDIKDEVKVLQGLLSKAGQKPEDYKTLRSPATVDLIFALANHGIDMRNGLFTEWPAAATTGDEVQRVQILAANPNAFLPIEFLYDFPPPTQDATMCPNAEQALLDGHCDPARFHQPVAADGAIPVVCPIGFWAMNRVIERHAQSATKRGKSRVRLPALDGAAAGLRSIPVPGRDTLGGISTALFANSDRVLDPDVKAVVKALKKAAKKGSTRAATWTDWVEDIKARGPDMLILLAHTAKNVRANQTALEIAAADQVPAGRFSEAHVRLRERANGDADDRPGPLVFLLGCETVLPWLEYQSFVVRFQEREASIVVGTVATVAASHAANVAVRLVEELAARTGERAGRHRAEAFGDVLLTARRRLLSEGEVMALCLTSYGDADWKLA